MGENMQDQTKKAPPAGNKTTGIYLLLFVSCLAFVAIAVAISAKPPARSDRCVPASAAQIDRIRYGIQAVEPDNDIKTAWAVRSADFERVWMVAALIYGDGIEDGAGPGVWAIGGEIERPNTTLSVGGFAHEFSAWGPAETTDAQITMNTDGVKEAVQCAELDKPK